MTEVAVKIRSKRNGGKLVILVGVFVSIKTDN